MQATKRQTYHSEQGSQAVSEPFKGVDMTK